MKKNMMISSLFGFTAGLLLVSESALSADSAHYFGFSYVSGAKEIWDWHEDNLNLDEFEDGAPIGISYRYAFLFDSGIRLDAGIGPFVLVTGDVEYTDAPIQMSLGYSFLETSDFRFYARLGATIHINDGDFLKEENAVGAVGAIGLEIGHSLSASFFVEASYDSAEAIFTDIALDDNFEPIRTEEDILVNGFMLTLGVRF
ncbi:MAG: outer membrane beta-barrel protein [Candidatus Thiodiazotropha endolucinida]